MIAFGRCFQRYCWFGYFIRGKGHDFQLGKIMYLFLWIHKSESPKGPRSSCFFYLPPICRYPRYGKKGEEGWSPKASKVSCRSSCTPSYVVDQTKSFQIQTLAAKGKADVHRVLLHSGCANLYPHPLPLIPTFPSVETF